MSGPGLERLLTSSDLVTATVLRSVLPLPSLSRPAVMGPARDWRGAGLGHCSVTAGVTAALNSTLAARSINNLLSFSFGYSAECSREG